MAARLQLNDAGGDGARATADTIAEIRSVKIQANAMRFGSRVDIATGTAAGRLSRDGRSPITNLDRIGMYCSVGVGRDAAG